MNIVVAFKDEARPLIDLLSLRPPPDDAIFPIYQRDDVRLIISGMGIENAEAAARFLCEQFSADANAATRWLNFGIAGSAQFQTGTVVIASNIRQQHTGEQWNCHRPPSIDLPATLVRTVEQPETAYAESGVYDMEAAGICRALHCAAEVSCVKLVTDGPGRPASRLKMKTVRAMLASIGPQLAAPLSALRCV